MEENNQIEMTPRAVYVSEVVEMLTLTEFSTVPYLNTNNRFTNKVSPSLSKVVISLVHTYNAL